MNREKLETEAKAPDWLDRLVEEIRARAAQGEHPSLTFLMESLLNELMTRERDRHLEDHPGEQANGLCERNLHLTLGKLRLRVPRVRSGKAFRPAILPPRWKRAHKDYEELLIAMLDGGYSQALGVHPQVLKPPVLPGCPRGRQGPHPRAAPVLQKSTTLLRLVRHLHRRLLEKAPR